MKACSAIILHGGAGIIEKGIKKQKMPVIRKALDAGWKALLEGKPVEQVVVAALELMEESEYFNAGYGGYPDSRGLVTLDVGLMKGSGDFRSYLNLRKLKYPSRLALDTLGLDNGLMSVWTDDDMREAERYTEAQKRRYGFFEDESELIAPYVKTLFAKESRFEVSAKPKTESGTIGCVVRNSQGEIAAGTSTGGIGHKARGRVGDSPIIGAGVYADNEICGLSATGHGESFLRCNVSGYILAEIRGELNSDPKVYEENAGRLKTVIQKELDTMHRLSGRVGGMIVLPRVGLPAYAFNSQSMSVAYRAELGDGSLEEEISVAEASKG